jgi:hypothetical protein
MVLSSHSPCDIAGIFIPHICLKVTVAEVWPQVNASGSILGSVRYVVAKFRGDPDAGVSDSIASFTTKLVEKPE